MRFAGLIATALAGAVIVAACGPAATPSGPLSACGADRQDMISIGGFPDLERELPTSLDGRAPDVVNSGRSCSDRALGSLVSHGIQELHYAGATWTRSQTEGSVVAVLATPPGQPAVQLPWIEEFYTAGAVAATKTDNVTTTRPTFESAGQVFQLDVLNDLSQQTIVIWQGERVIHVVIVATEVGPTASRADHDARIAAAVAIAAVPGPTPLPSAP